MKIFLICAAVIAGTAISGAPGAIGVAIGTMLANCYHAFD